MNAKARETDALGPALERASHAQEDLPDNDRIRFTISPSAREEIILRLIGLNQARHGHEHLSTPRRLNPASSSPTPADVDGSGGAQGKLFQKASLAEPSTESKRIIDFMVVLGGWYRKSEILAATGISDGQWAKIVADLISGGNIERQGEKRGTRYRAVTDRRSA